MTSKELKQQIGDRIYLGETRQQIFEHFDTLYPNRSKDIADLIVDIPTLADRKRFLPFQIAIIVLVVIALIIQLIAGIGMLRLYGPLAAIAMLIGPIVSTILLIGVLKWKPVYFRTIGQLAAWGVINAFAGVGIDGHEFRIDFGFGYRMLLTLPLMALSFYIFNGLRRKYHAKATRTTDAKGQIRTKYFIQFKE